MRKMGMMRNRMAFLLAAGTMAMVSAAGLAGCASAPASVTVQSAENTGITVTSQEKIKAEPDIAEIQCLFTGGGCEHLPVGESDGFGCGSGSFEGKGNCRYLGADERSGAESDL